MEIYLHLPDEEFKGVKDNRKWSSCKSKDRTVAVLNLNITIRSWQVPLVVDVRFGIRKIMCEEKGENPSKDTGRRKHNKMTGKRKRNNF